MIAALTLPGDLQDLLRPLRRRTPSGCGPGTATPPAAGTAGTARRRTLRAAASAATFSTGRTTRPSCSLTRPCVGFPSSAGIAHGAWAASACSACAVSSPARCWSARQVVAERQHAGVGDERQRPPARPAVDPAMMPSDAGVPTWCRSRGVVRHQDVGEERRVIRGRSTGGVGASGTTRRRPRSRRTRPCGPCPGRATANAARARCGPFRVRFRVVHPAGLPFGVWDGPRILPDRSGPNHGPTRGGSNDRPPRAVACPQRWHRSP